MPNEQSGLVVLRQVKLGPLGTLNVCINEMDKLVYQLLVQKPHNGGFVTKPLVVDASEVDLLLRIAER